ncbi:MAG: hypothetical protein V4505_24715, partial [Pseudomonadota bacterium]
MASFQEHFADHAGSALARQLALGDLIGQRPWSIDIQAGHIAFDDGLRFPMQMLGSHAFDSDSWLWIWANTQSNIPPELTQAAQRIRAVGDMQGIAEFAEPSLPLGAVTDHMLAMAGGGIAGGLPYYRAPYDGGALFVLLRDVPAEISAPVPGPRAIAVLTQVVSQFEVDHRRMAESFLRQQGFTLDSASPARLLATRGSETGLEVGFDTRGRINNIAGSLKPPAPP